MGSLIIGDERPAVYTMNPGDGPHSYARNSSYQRGVVDAAKPIIEEEIAKNLDIKRLPSSALCIGDFGCSTGHNSFPAMSIIVEAIKKKQQLSKPTPEFEFCVLFNDVVNNDFNTLFTSLPPHRGYHAAAVAGDFRGRLLPPSSLHFAYSSWALHWLTKAPAAASNKGRIFYAEDRKEVCEAYLEQFGKDMELFMESRAVEVVVVGGLTALFIHGVPPSWDPHGKLSEEKIDSFNTPFYISTPQQVKDIILRSNSFSIERMVIVNNPHKREAGSVEARAAMYRAVLEELLAHHFGSEIMDELFHLYMNKFAASPVFSNPNNDKTIVILVVLKRI